MKDWIVEKFGVSAYLVFQTVGYVLLATPYCIITRYYDTSLWVDILIILGMSLLYILPIIGVVAEITLWIWSFVLSLSMEPCFLLIAYYIALVLRFLPVIIFLVVPFVLVSAVKIKEKSKKGTEQQRANTKDQNTENSFDSDWELVIERMFDSMPMLALKLAVSNTSSIENTKSILIIADAEYQAEAISQHDHINEIKKYLTAVNKKYIDYSIVVKSDKDIEREKRGAEQQITNAEEQSMENSFDSDWDYVIKKISKSMPLHAVHLISAKKHLDKNKKAITIIAESRFAASMLSECDCKNEIRECLISANKKYIDYHINIESDENIENEGKDANPQNKATDNHGEKIITRSDWISVIDKMSEFAPLKAMYLISSNATINAKSKTLTIIARNEFEASSMSETEFKDEMKKHLIAVNEKFVDYNIVVKNNEDVKNEKSGSEQQSVNAKDQNVEDPNTELSIDSDWEYVINNIFKSMPLESVYLSMSEKILDQSAKTLTITVGSAMGELITSKSVCVNEIKKNLVAVNKKYNDYRIIVKSNENIDRNLLVKTSLLFNMIVDCVEGHGFKEKDVAETYYDMVQEGFEPSDIQKELMYSIQPIYSTVGPKDKGKIRRLLIDYCGYGDDYDFEEWD